ncbi:retrotransposon protein, putative, ty1-copia subclass [Tanacetum coccineum]|uniref:Retrotransposon protein, putative, ty1-copia subclass n=1 Tax=Tanacetum coccineum TaxID=301880 RepID=A0ABQ4ZJA6_9ASTR
MVSPIVFRLLTTLKRVVKLKSRIEGLPKNYKRISEKTVLMVRQVKMMHIRAFRPAYKLLIGCTPYKLVLCGKVTLTRRTSNTRQIGRLIIANFDLKTAGDHRKLQLNELSELRDQAYENSLIYKEKDKEVYMIPNKRTESSMFGDQVLLFNSRLKIFSGKLRIPRSPTVHNHRSIISYGTASVSAEFEFQNQLPPSLSITMKGDTPHWFYSDLQKTFPKDTHKIQDRVELATRLETRDMDTKLLSAPESNNTLARCSSLGIVVGGLLALICIMPDKCKIHISVRIYQKSQENSQKNEQARTRESEEYKKKPKNQKPEAEARKVKPQLLEFLRNSIFKKSVECVEFKEIQDEDTSPFENTSKILVEVEGFEPPQEEVIHVRSRFQQNPGEPHWTAVKTILKYLRNTKDMFFVYGGNPEAELQVDCYCDDGFETDRDGIKSETRYVFVLNGGAVDWKSSKQSTTAMSATKAEYIAASEAVMKVQIHEDDLDEMDLKWQLALLSMKARKFYQRTGKKIIINGSDIAGYDKKKVECFNCHKLGHFARECRNPRSQENRNRSQDSSRRTVNVE